MLEEYRDIISKLKQEDAHFAKQFEKHNDLDNKLKNESEHLTDVDIEKLKKEKLALKDAIYAEILKYKKDNNL
jgi:uncharacterized protein YdcH (DUF465 family)